MITEKSSYIQCDLVELLNHKIFSVINQAITLFIACSSLVIPSYDKKSSNSSINVQSFLALRQ